MFTPKNIQGALEELYDLCDPDYSVRIGGSIRISKKSFDEWLDHQM